MKHTILSYLILTISITLTLHASKQDDLWKISSSGATYPINYFKDFDANIKNEDGQTPLMIATKNSNDEVIRSLFEAKVNVFDTDYEGKTAFDYIKTFSNTEIERKSTSVYGVLKTLEAYQIIRGKAKIVQYHYNRETNDLGITIKGNNCDNFIFPEQVKCQALKKRVESNHQIFKDIKDHNNTAFDIQINNVDLELKNKSNYSLLWAGIFYNNNYVVNAVLKKGADINEADPNRLHIPISWAVQQNDVKLLQVLLDNGVDVNSIMKFGDPVIFKAMFQCNSFETISLLLDNGANPYLKNKRGKTVFDEEPVFCKDKKDIEKMRNILKERSNFSS